MEKQHTAMPVIAGVLDIVHAAFGFLFLFGLIVAMVAFPMQHTTFPYRMWAGYSVPMAALLSLAIPCAIISVLSLLGGIAAIQRRRWGLALTGSIAAILPSFVTGTVTVVLVALSRDEFER